MPKRIIHLDHKVVIRPRRSYIISTNKLDWDMSECNDIIEELGRMKYFDGLDIEIEYETEERCEFCNCIWEEDDEGYPVCCQEAITDFEREMLKRYKDA